MGLVEAPSAKRKKCIIVSLKLFWLCTDLPHFDPKQRLSLAMWELFFKADYQLFLNGLWGLVDDFWSKISRWFNYMPGEKKNRDGLGGWMLTGQTFCDIKHCAATQETHPPSKRS